MFETTAKDYTSNSWHIGRGRRPRDQNFNYRPSYYNFDFQTAFTPNWLETIYEKPLRMAHFLDYGGAGVAQR